MTASSRSGSVGEARSIYERSIVIDGSVAPHMDEGYVARMLASGVTAFNWTVCPPWDDLGQGLASIADGLTLIDRYSDRLLLVRTVADIERAKREGRVGLIFGPQNAKLAEGDPRHFRILREVGVTIVQLTYNERNLFGDGATEPANAGLSEAGRRAIAAMNEAGILIDLSHCGDRTTLEAIEASSRPVAITHANARAVFASPRNKTDEALKALAARGGIIGLTLWSPMVGTSTGSWPTLDDYLRHVRYVADLIGPEHVGIGTDHSEGTPRDEWDAKFGPDGPYRSVTGGLGPWYNYDTRFVKNGLRCTDVPSVAEAIAGLGFTAAELAGILGGNFLKVFRRAWGEAA